MTTTILTILLALALAAAAALHGLADVASGTGALAAFAGAGIALAVLLAFGTPSRRAFKDLGLRRGAVALAAGAAAVLAPVAVSAVRYSDAPSGSVFVFVTTSLWGLLALAAALALRPQASSAARLAGGLLAAVAGAGILANWERPSSFNPIVRFPLEQAAMLAAGALWIGGLAALAIPSRKAPAAPVAGAYAVGAVLAGAAVALPQPDSLAAADPMSVLPWAVTLGFAAALAAMLASRSRVHLVGLAALAAPALLTGLTIVEQVTGMLGPRPILVAPAIGAIALVALGIASAAWVPEQRPDATGAPALGVPLRRVGLGLATAAAVVAAVSLATPTLRATVHGTRAETMASFDVSFAMRGFEVLGPWLAVAAAVLAVVAWLPLPRVASAMNAAAAIGASAAALAPLGATPLHIWMTWIPADVQQDYGTEYAYIVFEPLRSVALLVATVVCILSAMLLLARLLLPSAGTRTSDRAPADGGMTEAR